MEVVIHPHSYYHWMSLNNFIWTLVTPEAGDILESGVLKLKCAVISKQEHLSQGITVVTMYMKVYQKCYKGINFDSL